MNGFEIAGKKMMDNALIPWAIGSLARALLFYGQAQTYNDRRALGVIATYYSLFHLGMFLIFLSTFLKTTDAAGAIT